MRFNVDILRACAYGSVFRVTLTRLNIPSMTSRNGDFLRVLWKLRKPICHWCGNQLFLRDGPQKRSRLSDATVDHLCPRDYGGKSTLMNGVLSCGRCNQLRAAAGHCLGALACARTVLPYVDNPGNVARWLQPSTGVTPQKRIRAREQGPVQPQALLEPTQAALALALEQVIKQRARSDQT